MQDGQRYWFAVAYAKDCGLFAFDHYIGSSEVLQCSHDSYARCINQPTVVVDDMYVSAESEAFRAGDDAERFRVQCVGATNGFLQYAREDDFGISRTSTQLDTPPFGPLKNIPANFKRRRSHW